jgi:hypothetical protein
VGVEKMKSTIQYHTDSERNDILSQDSNLVLLEEQNITEGNFLIFSDNPTVDQKDIVYVNVDQQEFNKMQSQFKTYDEKYKELDLNTTTLADVQNAKMAQLTEVCNKSITDGFDFTINTVSYKFSCSLEAQSNFQGTDTLFKDGIITDTQWTVENNDNRKTERITLDQITFNSLKLEVFSHINTNISKLRNTLQPQVESTTSNQDVDAINW